MRYLKFKQYGALAEELVQGRDWPRIHRRTEAAGHTDRDSTTPDRRGILRRTSTRSRSSRFQPLALEHDDRSRGRNKIEQGLRNLFLPAAAQNGGGKEGVVLQFSR